MFKQTYLLHRMDNIETSMNNLVRQGNLMEDFVFESWFRLKY